MPRRVFKLSKAQANQLRQYYGELGRVQRDIQVMTTAIIQERGFDPDIALLRGLEGDNMIVETLTPAPAPKKARK